MSDKDRLSRYIKLGDINTQRQIKHKGGNLKKEKIFKEINSSIAEPTPENLETQPICPECDNEDLLVFIIESLRLKEPEKRQEFIKKVACFNCESEWGRTKEGEIAKLE